MYGVSLELVGAPVPGFYREILNSDSVLYGGSNLGNAGGLPADDLPWQGQPYSLLLTLPPLAVVYLKPEKVGGGAGNSARQQFVVEVISGLGRPRLKIACATAAPKGYGNQSAGSARPGLERQP